MDMKRIAYTALIAAASMSAAATAAVTEAPAPGPSADAVVALPAVGSLVGASILSFFALCMH
ncbi:hypothetical protein ACS0TY_019919 [Phlomoides rotata]